MKKTLLLCLGSTTIIYIIVYLVIAFSYWELKNPFQWIIDLPTYAPEERLALLTAYFMYQGMQFFIITNREDLCRN